MDCRPRCRRPARYAPRQLIDDLDGLIARHCTFDTTTPAGRSIAETAGNSVLSLAFWMRQGALYEPTAALHRLLEASDIASDVPLGLLHLPAPALCFVPEPSMRSHPDGFEAVLLFEHGGPQGYDPDERWLTLSLWREDKSQPGTRTVEILRLCVDDPAESIAQVVEPLFDEFAMSPERQRRWRLILDYIMKLLLYLSLENAPVIHERPYSTAPREFPGLGKRKRSERLAAIECLYDRYVIGPAVLADAPEHTHDDGDGHAVRTHWRRGHFRMQPFGPAAAQRKLIFVMPTIVRADKLGSATSRST
jgi:hypothetical protein